MTFSPYAGKRLTQSNVVQLAGHIFQGHTFRAPRTRTEGASILIGRIHNRDEIFTEGQIDNIKPLGDR